MDDVDRAILTVLEKDGRINNSDLAEQVGLSPSPCLRRVRRLEETGVIRGYQALIDPAAVASAAQRAGLDAAELRAGAPSDAELDKLHEQFTQEALSAGVFGAPSYVLPSGEIFWGQDRLELLERALKNLAL